MVPPQVPERCWPVGHVLRSHAWQVPGLAPSGIGWYCRQCLAMVLQLNPLLVPLQEPERCWPVGHVIRSHVWQVPGLAPSRYWLVLQTMFGDGGAREPVGGPAAGSLIAAGRLGSHIARMLAGARVGTERYWLAAQTMFGMGLQLNPLVVPLQEPERCWPVGHVMLSHVWHVPGLAPTRYWLVLQTMFGMVVQLNPLVVPLQEPERCWPVGHVMRRMLWQVPGLAPEPVLVGTADNIWRDASHLCLPTRRPFVCRVARTHARRLDGILRNGRLAAAAAVVPPREARGPARILHSEGRHTLVRPASAHPGTPRLERWKQVQGVPKFLVGSELHPVQGMLVVLGNAAYAAVVVGGRVELARGEALVARLDEPLGCHGDALRHAEPVVVHGAQVEFSHHLPLRAGFHAQLECFAGIFRDTPAVTVGGGQPVLPHGVPLARGKRVPFEGLGVVSGDTKRVLVHQPQPDLWLDDSCSGGRGWQPA